MVERTITTPTLRAAAPANDVALILDATPESGENIGLAMCLIDDEGEEFGCKNIRLKAGADVRLVVGTKAMCRLMELYGNVADEPFIGDPFPE